MNGPEKIKRIKEQTVKLPLTL